MSIITGVIKTLTSKFGVTLPVTVTKAVYDETTGEKLDLILDKLKLKLLWSGNIGKGETNDVNITGYDMYILIIDGCPVLGYPLGNNPIKIRGCSGLMINEGDTAMALCTVMLHAYASNIFCEFATSFSFSNTSGITTGNNIFTDRKISTIYGLRC